MVRILVILSLILGGIAMAAPRDQNFDPMKQVPTPNGTMKEQGSEPTREEVMMHMWRRFAGDKPMPEEMRRKYGLPAEAPPIPAGR